MKRPVYKIGGPLEEADIYRQGAEDFLLEALELLCTSGNPEFSSPEGLKEAHADITVKLAQALVHLRITAEELRKLAERGVQVASAT